MGAEVGEVDEGHGRWLMGIGRVRGGGGGGLARRRVVWVDAQWMVESFCR